jgi:dimethylargininase
MPTALLREIPDSFDRAIVGPGGRAPDVGLAREQHSVYRDHLERAGYTVETLTADEGCPDCVFVEDTAVIVGETAVITRPGAPERRPEVPPVADFLAERFPTTHIEAPGTLDGGDVMILGGRVYVGVSRRSNREGIDQLGTAATSQGFDLVVVPVDGALHLKSAVLPVGDETVVITRGTVDESLLTGLRLVYEPDDERLSFSALPLADGRVMTTSSAPQTASLLEGIGLEVTPIDVSEILATDGGLTCMSILYDS